MRTKIPHKIPLALAISLLEALLLSAQEPTSTVQTQARQASQAQDALKQDAVAIQAELAKLREEVRQFLPEDLELVDRASSQMASLSSNEMDEVIQSLSAASKAGNLSAQVQAFAGAIKRQQQIGAKLKDLATDLHGRPELVSLGQKLRDLLPRQICEQRSLGRIALLSPTPKAMLDRLREPYDIVCGNQDNISQELRISVKAISLEAINSPVFAKLEKISADQKLGENAARAAFLTRMGPFDQATLAQANVAQSLTAMIQLLDADEKPAEQARTLKQQISEIEDKLMAAAESKEDRFRKRQEAEAESRAAALSAELGTANARAAQELQKAEAAIQRANSTTQGQESKGTESNFAPQAQAEALSALEEAKEAMESQLGKAPSSPGEQRLDRAEQHLAQAAAATRLAQVNFGSESTAADASKQIQTAQQQVAEAEAAAKEANAPSPQALAQAHQQLSIAQQCASANALPQAQSAAQAARKALAAAGAAFSTAGSGNSQGAAPGRGTQDQQHAQGGGVATNQGLLSGAGNQNPPPTVRVLSGLNPHDREAVAQFQKQAPPPAFATEVQQYYKNLSEDSGL